MHVSSDTLRLELARRNPNDFVEYVMRDEQTGAPVKQAPMHVAWQQLLNTESRLIVWSHLEGGKSNQISIGRILWEIGKHPEIRIVILSNTSTQATKIIRSIAGYIERSPEYHAVFPHVKPQEPWTTTQLTVQRPTIGKDPTVQALGVHGNITGARIDLLIWDDVLDYENTRTAEQRKEFYEWAKAALLGRLNGRLWVVGNAYHPEDALHQLAATPGVKAVRYPVIDDATGEPRWPERWPMSRIDAKRVELGPLEFGRQMMCVARDDAEARFRRDWIDLCIARGHDKIMAGALSSVPAGFRTYTGVDLAVSPKDSADLTVLFTIAVHPDETRQVLCVESGRWAGPDIVDRIIDTHKRYHSIVWVESNAAQMFITQFTKNISAVPVRSFQTTGKNKFDPSFGVESIAAEMSAGKWIIPSKGGLHPELQGWVNEMLYYNPAGHTGDRLMASWIAREGSRNNPRKMETGVLRLNSAI